MTMEKWTVYRARLGAIKRFHPDDLEAIHQAERELLEARKAQFGTDERDAALSQIVSLLPHFTPEQKEALICAVEGAR